MNWLVHKSYVLTVVLIRLYKWLEFQVFKFLTPWLTYKAKEIAAELNVWIHCPGEIDTSKEALVTKSKYEKAIHVKVHDNLYFTRAANTGDLGYGETYVEGKWDVSGDPEDLSQFGARLLENNKLDLYYNRWNKFLEWAEHHAFNLQTRERAFQVGEAHYDIGNDLFKIMLDPWMQYTCGYWKTATNLNEAQLDKMELIAKKLDLKPGMRVLDIGCGWGTLTKFLSERYGVECVGVTISKEGVAYGKKICQGLPVDIRFQDYREVNESFDRIVSVGMFEHVGFRNYKEFFQVCRNCLKEDGLVLLHTIGRNHTNYPLGTIPWAEKYIFPNGYLPDPCQIAEVTKGLFILEDWHNFGPHYAKTLFCWRENFIKGWPTIEEKYGGDKFYRMWIYYLSMARALFLSRRCQLWQILLSKDGLKREYQAAR